MGVYLRIRTALHWPGGNNGGSSATVCSGDTMLRVGEGLVMTSLLTAAAAPATDMRFLWWCEEARRL